MTDDRQDAVTRYEFDAFGNQTNLINTVVANGSTTSTTWDLLGKILSRTDEFGRSAPRVT